MYEPAMSRKQASAFPAFHEPECPRASSFSDIGSDAHIGSDVKSAAESANRPAVTLITTDHWLREWFTDLILPTSRYAHADLEFVEIAANPSAPAELIARVKEAIVRRPHAACFACTDCAMEAYSAAVEELRAEARPPAAVPGASGGAPPASQPAPLGSSFLCYYLTTNKFACRSRVAGCGDLKCAPVFRRDARLPDLGVEGFFKPLAECGSKGVCRYPAGGGTPNPLFAPPGAPAPQCSLVCDAAFVELAAGHRELNDLGEQTKGIVGLVEEYVHPASRRAVVSIDGFVKDGAITHYCISDNVYDKDAPEMFDSLVTPTQRLSKAEISACWAKYDVVVADLVRRGANNQFIDVEAFVLGDDGSAEEGGGGGGGAVVIKTMEVNCRTFSNQLPVFSKLFGGEGGDGCMISAAIDLLLGETPPIDRSYSETIVIPAGAGLEGRAVGVCAYLPLLPGCPTVVQSEDAWYYGVGGFDAHVYAFGKSGEAAARARCEEFYAELAAKYTCAA